MWGRQLDRSSAGRARFHSRGVRSLEFDLLFVVFDAIEVRPRDSRVRLRFRPQELEGGQVMAPLHSRCEVRVLGTPLRDQGEHRAHIRGRDRLSFRTVNRRERNHASHPSRQKELKRQDPVHKRSASGRPLLLALHQIKTPDAGDPTPGEALRYAPDPTAAGKIGEASSRCGRAT